MDYDHAYAENLAYFGDAPDPLLPRFLHILDRDRMVLDVGCGQGRNTVYLARRGFQVVALDPSRVAVDQLQTIVADEELPVLAVHGGFEAFEAEHEDYGGVMSFGLIPDLPLLAALALVRRIRELVGPAGAAWVTGFTTEDPVYQFHATEWEHVGEHSFTSPAGTTRTYLAPGKIVDLFDGFEVIHHWEGLGPYHRHGDGPVERHARFEAVFRRS